MALYGDFLGDAQDKYSRKFFIIHNRGLIFS